jgi:hypothetical protein
MDEYSRQDGGIAAPVSPIKEVLQSFQSECPIADIPNKSPSVKWAVNGGAVKNPLLHLSKGK